MAERQSVAQVQQFGKEVTPGTAVAATKRLGSMSLSPGVQAEVGMFRPQGLKFATVQALNQEWVEGDAEGQPTYDEVIYPLAGVFGAPVTSAIQDGVTPTGAFQHVFTPSSSEADAPVTYTLEQGDAVQAELMTHLLFTQFGLEVSRSEVSLAASFFAKSIQQDITLTPGLDIPADLKPILPGHFSVYVADTAADLGTDQERLVRVISVNPSVGDKYTPAWFVNALEESFTTFTEAAEGPSSESAITLEADAVGMGLLPKLRDGSTLYLRLEAKGGANIYNAGTQLNLQHRFTWDMALKCNAVDTWSDEDGVWAIPFTYQMVHDATWGKSQRITVVNKVAAL